MAIPVTYKDQDRQIFLAYWYDKLARHLLKAKPLSFDEWMDSKTMCRFDVYDDSISACIEIKGSSNMDQMKLFEDQLDGQLGELGFPFDLGFVWIFSYRNFIQKNRIRSRLLKKNGKTSMNVSEFLAKNTNVVYAVDVNLLSALRHRNGTRLYTRDKSRERRIVSINRTQLRECAESVRSTLEDLNLSGEIARWLPPNAKRIPSRFIETEMDGNPIHFELVLLLPNALKVRLLRQMNGSVSRK